QGISLVLLALGMMRGQPTLALIGIFIFFAARQEYQVLLRQTRMVRTRAADIMEPVLHQIFLGQSIEAARESVAGREAAAYIVWSRPGIPAGYITRERLTGTKPPLPPESLIDPWVIPAPLA